MRTYLVKKSQVFHRNSIVGGSLFLMSFASFKNGKYTEITHPVSCRDVFCSTEVVSKLKEFLPKGELSRTTNRNPILPRNVKIALYIKDHIRLTRSIKFLREIEKSLGFSKTIINIAETKQPINYDKVLYMTNQIRTLLPEDLSKVVVLSFDKRWMANQISLSAYLGIIRYLMSNKIPDDTYDKRLKLVMDAVTDSNIHGSLFIKLWGELHDNKSINTFGVDVSNMDVRVGRYTDTIELNRSLELYNGMYGYGIRRFVNDVVRQGGSTPLYMSGLVDRMRKLIEREENSDFMRLAA